MDFPEIIQGGMGVGVSNWRLALAVSSQGQLGVVSATGIDSVMVRRLQDGDKDGTTRNALAHFPIPEIANRILQKYFRPNGRTPGEPYKTSPMGAVPSSEEWEDLVVVATFAEVFMAKAGNCWKAGINLLEKIQLPTLPSLYGAILAGVDYVLMGAGIPRAIPGALDKLSANQEASLKLDVRDCAPTEGFWSKFNPARFFSPRTAHLKRPVFLAIITSHVLAQNLATKADGVVDGFVIEGPTAGGHNAPPRGTLNLDPNGEPIYTERDAPDLEKIRQIGKPFWLAGSYGTPDGLARAKAQGARGIQVGTAFAFCDESGITPKIKLSVIENCRQKIARVFTDIKASPTGFPFKVLGLPGTLSQKEDYEKRPRVCDVGCLRTIFKKSDGSIGYRCPAENPSAFAAKGGDLEETPCRKCLCNSLLATIGLGQIRADGSHEPPLITVGDSVEKTVCAIAKGRASYSAADVLEYLGAHA
jgi:nitronate monooxygenase